MGQQDQGLLGRTSMKRVDRRSALKIGFAAASAAVVKQAAAQTTDALAGKDTSPLVDPEAWTETGQT
jgi:hypothetical protein